MNPDEHAGSVRDARQRTLDLIADLSDEQLLGPRLAILNPLRWEVAHVAWFQEKWVLRRAGGPPYRPDVDALYDSMAVPHDTRWDLPLYSRADTLAYLREVRDRVLERIYGGRLAPDDAYFILLTVLHEDMHTEAFTYTRQTLGYPAPSFPDRDGVGEEPEGGPLPGDVEIPGGTFPLGAAPDEPFVFDNEKWAHPVEVAPFRMARAPVTQAEYADFVKDGGYQRRECWSDTGWAWRETAGAEGPLYWECGMRNAECGLGTAGSASPEAAQEAGPGSPQSAIPNLHSAIQRRHFDRWVPLEPHRPVLHVNWYEAEAYCRWAGRRLPTEAEWEFAAAWDPAAGRKRRYPWGDEPPSSERANLDWRGGTPFAGGGCLDVGALPAGDSAFGCRQMIGNVWEWTRDDFAPYPGFVADPYKEYSEPWFHTHKVLRGGCWATRSRLIRNTWRNFYRPDRRDVWAGFRTCAL